MIKMFEIMDSKDKNIYSLNDMIDMYDLEPLNYSFVHKRLCCPCCFSKDITIKITSDIAYIRSKKAGHDVTCDYYGHKISQAFIKKELKKQYDFKKEFDEVYNGVNTLSKAFPKKCIDRKLSEDDYDVIKIFYGNVSVKNAHSKDPDRYMNFSLKAPKGDILNLTITRNAFIHAKDLVKQLNKALDYNLDVYIMGKIEQKEGYNNIRVEHSSMIRIKGDK